MKEVKANYIVGAGGAGLILASFMPFITVKIALSAMGLGIDQEQSVTIFDMSKGFYFIPLLGAVGLIIAFLKQNSQFNSATAGIVVGVLAICLALYAGASTKSAFDEVMRQSMFMMQMMKLDANVNMKDFVESHLGLGAYLSVLSGIMLTFGGWKLRQAESC